MYSGIEENFVGVDVPDPGYRCLIEKNGFNAAFSFGEDGCEFFESDSERLGTEPGQLSATDGGIAFDDDTEAEFPDIMETQFVGAVSELQNETCMLVDGLSGLG